MAGVARNAPCPCGSGRRYKECHGALADTSAEAATDAPPWLAQTMRDALQAQRSDRGGVAARLYRRVLEADPENFDATHMLGLVEYERGYHDSALALVRRAIELRPDLDMPRHNLRLLETLPRVETEICREILPRLMSRVDLAFDAGCVASAATTHLVIGDAPGEPQDAVLAQIVAARGTATTTIWENAGPDVVAPGGRARKLSANDHPCGGLLVLVGAGRAAAAWLRGTRAERALLIVTHDEPCAVIDRIDELAAAGYERPGLLCATRALAERLRLPVGATLPQPIGAARVPA
jgi:tetratricopeptide (TPR) repeat protein